MKRLLLLLLVLSFSTLAADDKAKIAFDFLGEIKNENFSNASKMANSEMQAFLSEEKIKQFYSSFQTQYGKFLKIGEPALQKSTENWLYLVNVYFTQDSLRARVVVDSSNRIAGLFFMPFPKNYSFKLPSYADTSKFREEEVKFGYDDWKLPAVLSIPNSAKPMPVVILVHGSGPNDKDETIGGFKIFRDIAYGLASNGIAVLRYEKRTKWHSQKIMKSYYTLTVNEETIDDAVEAVEFLRNRKEIDSKNIFILGHSLGAYLMPRIAFRARDIAGAIMLAGNARKLYDIVPEQYEYIFSLDGELSDIEKMEIEKVKMQVELIKNKKITNETSRDSLLLGLKPTYWYDLLDYEPLFLTTRLKMPLLIMQGAKDYQVTTKEFELWKKTLSGNDKVSFKLFDNLNHLFVHTEGKSKPKDYEAEGNVDTNAIDTLIKWINDNKNK